MALARAQDEPVHGPPECVGSAERGGQEQVENSTSAQQRRATWCSEPGRSEPGNEKGFAETGG